MWTAHGIAGGAGEIAPVSDLHYSKTAVLLMIKAKAAVIGTAIDGGGIETQGRFRRFVVIADILIIRHIRSDQDLKGPVMGAMFQHIHLAVLKDDLGIHASQTFRADAYCKIIVSVGSFGHNE